MDTSEKQVLVSAVDLNPTDMALPDRDMTPVFTINGLLLHRTMTMNL